MKELQELFKKKGSKPMDKNVKSAKMSALSDMAKEMDSMIGDDVKGFKKVTVAAPDKQGLAAGLSKAEDMLGVEGGSEEEASEDDDMVAGVDVDALSPEDCDKLLKALEAKKAEHKY